MNTNKKVIRLCAFVMGVSGLVILFSTLFPIFSYEWSADQKYPKLISPLVDEEKASFTFDNRDFTKLSSWFEDQKKLPASDDNISFFTISIPKLRIEDAVVKIGGEELSGSLIQYPGTALPGRVGNAVIFGHSILPQYYNPKNYLSIFSLLGDLEAGDKIYASMDNKIFVYEVFNSFEVKPTDLGILDQNKKGSFISLITCTPPGHPLKPKRLIVRAKLVDIKS
ncbi:MAG: hypothetical protein US62_C0038G0007 [Candidatus Woesebacteria bacterium GW2011_GWA1_37_8]|uniref:Sortase family protein n=2 Tax=Candidatus Woeseibacteriota TaxID=1752722 RepID=A0A0G0NKD1_9BACT|nr:MAG: hypothetical protein US39_C0001G0017 [Microgenomates group bacterium GW2011_GWC1_37_12b]KKQ43950.1 MAG: hypothetical protein US62_C0038G0007 [Candidatus Woesebacteria bacterium GW2011_GWA1_37_8]KKQ86354.1 MAG: hypothetical protein UT10_C0027G0004 [Candidatus Woesebacteria bacterium GW2011_GWB1_38_8b]